MTDPQEHLRICMLYEFKLGRSAHGAYKNLIRAYGEGVVARSTVTRWFSKFRLGNESIEKGTTNGLSMVLDDDELEEAVRKNPKITRAQLSELFGVGESTVYNHLRKIKEGAKMTYIGHKKRREPIEAVRLIAQSIESTHHPDTNADLCARASENPCLELLEVKKTNGEGGTGIIIVMPAIKEDFSKEESRDRVVVECPRSADVRSQPDSARDVKLSLADDTKEHVSYLL
ncbi:hypothetical protein GCK32_014177 [Trichostrongylus colubriformis]|uniref:Mos1 transposase HTH domain-containing protein n=1 Tax=Trichostrongylus colubriformis TaxID=6319 RepID=A0AAN8FEU5_TRICO